MNRILFELTGPHFDLAIGEIKAVLEGSAQSYDIVSSDVGILCVETGCSIDTLCQRIGLTHRILLHKMKASEDSLKQGDFELDVSPGKVAVDTRRIGGKEADTKEIRSVLGDVLSEEHGIDLEEPDVEVIALISDRCYVGEVVCEMDKQDFKKREVKNRPYSSPISLKPRLTRALINLGRVKEGDTLHDPFCGTGGVLLEAGLMGLNISGGDADPNMVRGTEENLKNFAMDCEIKEGDVSETIPDGVDCIATDPPYGRASSTSGEELSSVYRRLFETAEKKLKDGGHLSVIFPKRKYCEEGEEYLTFIEHHKTRVHGSLDRHFCVFRKD